MEEVASLLISCQIFSRDEKRMESNTLRVLLCETSNAELLHRSLQTASLEVVIPDPTTYIERRRRTALVYQALYQASIKR